MKWQVQISGNQVDLEELTLSLQSPSTRVSQEANGYILESDQFDSLAESGAVLEKAKEFLKLISGGAKLAIGMREPLIAGNVISIDSSGLRHIFCNINEAITIRAIPNVLFLDKDGDVKTLRASDVVASWLKAAWNNQSVAKVMRLYSQGIDWANLYRIFEVIKQDIGNIKQIEKRGWATQKALDLFTHTANSPLAIGDDSRHGATKNKPPEKPMPFGEAKVLIEGLMRNWLDSKINERPR